jgi:branched-chain amino acid transport system ATP-binding protein
VSLQRSEAAPDGAALEVGDVSVQFGGITALDQVSFGVERAEVFGVIGPNGAGKTTLFDVISGICRPSQGSVRLDGLDVTRRSALWRARHGMRRTFQRQQVFGGLSVEDNLLVAQEWVSRSGGVVFDLLGVSLARSTQRTRRERVDEVLDLCGLTAVRHSYAAKLPIGMARLVELGRAIVDPPQVLLLDEPSSGLGDAEQQRLSDALRRIQAHHECAVLLVEHDVGFVMSHCDRILVLNLGSKIADGTPPQIREDAAVRAAYLG